MIDQPKSSPKNMPLFPKGQLLRGPNVHHHATVYAQPFVPGLIGRMRAGEFGKGFIEGVLDRYRDLEVLDRESCFRPGVEEALEKGEILVPDLLLELTLAAEAAAAALMRRFEAGSFGVVVPGPDPATTLLVWDAWSGGISRVASRAALATILDFAPRGLVPGSTEDFHALMAWLRKRARRRQWTPNTAVLAHAAGRRGVPHEPLAGSYLRLGDGDLQHVVTSSAIAGPGAGPAGARDVAPAGRRHQLLVVAGECVSAVRLDPPVLFGDGVHSVRGLIELLNQEPRRRGAGLYPVVVDQAMEEDLAERGWAVDTRPAAGTEIRLDTVAEFEDGAVPVDVTGRAHDFNRSLAVQEADARGLQLAAVDLAISDIGRSGNRGRARVLRVDPQPDLFLHAISSPARLDAVGGHVLDALFPPDLPARVPTALVLGEKGTSRIARGVDRFLRVSRRGVALWTHDRATILGSPVRRAGSSHRAGADDLLRDPRVDVLVSAFSPRRVVERGLRLEQVTCVALLDPEAGGWSGPRDEGVRVVLQATTGCVCVSAGDPELDTVLGLVNPSRVVVVSDDRDHPRAAAHLESGGVVVSARLGGPEPAILRESAGEPVLEIPLSLMRTGVGELDETALWRVLWTGALAFGLGITGPPPAPVEEEGAEDPLRNPSA